MIGRPPRSTLFPYTPLCRSACMEELEELVVKHPAGTMPTAEPLTYLAVMAIMRRDRERAARLYPALLRSEEHTSELQSRQNLVFRLLLEKKKNAYRLPKSST